MGNWVERVMLGYHDIDEIKLVISRLTQESIFFKSKTASTTNSKVKNR